ncbi:hypothetical protein EIN_284010 [Entamoeba invadens IP1]|uniref:Glycosyl hydrolase family 13 catalytic domain-containing protein n=2 Tax=Entamoeba invadens TaxID=33085 RepID=L7FJX4_ENTIV|nr:hypothetical protein EIN_284010 [Entamoeba invadens IP1]ELP84845.1 hypothetical protein EIN_284010 [Entamoeba invadens IP1]|eukprot:XP_004184191.1 hypothetical protein EIN_284010 [Entamoeba invadens IP1]
MYPVVYEISTRPWLYELSQKYSRDITTIRQIPLVEFDLLKTKGIDYVWMMGVWQLGNYGLEIDKKVNYSYVLPDYTEDDIIGSPYAITQYVCNKEIGIDEDLIWLKTQLHARGLKLMLDFVPNHSACDAPTVSSNPELYVRAKRAANYDPKYYLPNGVAHGSDPYFDPWGDTAQWNYFEQKTRDFMKENMMKVASIADGIRCDMAHLDLNEVFYSTWKDEMDAWGYKMPSTEFWADTITAVKKLYPKIVLMAEVYEDYQMAKLKECGFDYYYDKAFLDKVEQSVTEVNEYIAQHDIEFFNNAAHFVENHDENRAVYNMKTVKRADAAAALATTLPGLIFFNHGQFDGLENKLDVHLRRSYAEDVSPDAQNFYTVFTNILKNDAFRTKNFEIVPNLAGENPEQFSVWTRTATEKFLVVINYSEKEGSLNIPMLNVTPQEGQTTITFTDLMTNSDPITITQETLQTTGLGVQSAPYQVKIFKYL